MILQHSACEYSAQVFKLYQITRRLVIDLGSARQRIPRYQMSCRTAQNRSKVFNVDGNAPPIARDNVFAVEMVQVFRYLLA